MKRTRRTVLVWSAKATVIIIAAVTGVAIGLWLRQLWWPQPRTAGQQPPASQPATPTPTPVPRGLSKTDYSLTIPAQRAKDYPGGAVVTERAPQERDGFRSGLISFESDGLKQYAQVTLPATPQPAGGYPVIILVHGYITPTVYTSDEPFYSDWAADFARRGYLVVKPDLRGHGNSWGVPEGAYFSSGYVSDVLNLTTSLADYAPANARQIALMGHSMGGHVALDAALVRPDWYRALVLAASATGSQSDMYNQWRANSDFGSPVTFGIRQRVITLFGEPEDGDPFWQASDPYRYLADLKVPTALYHATADDTVPYRFSQELETALKAAGRPVTLTPYADGGHSLTGPVRAQVLADIVKFLKPNQP